MRISRALLVLLFTLVSLSTLGVPAHRDLTRYTQPDGSVVEVYLRGDEFFSYIITSGGDVVAQGDDGYLYYARYDYNGIEVSSVRVGGGGLTKSIAGMGGVSGDVVRALRQRSTMWQDMYGSSSRRRTKSSTKAVHPERGLILLVEFADSRLTYSKSYFENMSNQTGYSYNGAVGSAKQYFNDNSNGRYDPDFDVYGPYRLDNDLKYYGANNNQNNDIRPREMVAEACDKASAAGVDFSKYDGDGDGVIDMVYVYYAGYGENETGSVNHIWPHKWSASNQNRSYNGRRLDVYACSNELRGTSGSTLTGIGTFCHEFSHVLGLVDMYDTDKEQGGESVGLKTLSLMDGGSYNGGGNVPPYYSALERQEAGWITIPQFPTGAAQLEPVYNDKAYMVNSSVLGEYFIFEVRDGTGWDSKMYGEAPVKGMLVYHVDRSSDRNVEGNAVSELWENNMVNAYASHQCVRVLPATGGAFTGVSPRIFYPGSTNVNQLLVSDAKVKDWSGVVMPINISSITQSGGSVLLNSTQNIRQVKGAVSSNVGVRLSGVTVKLSLVNATKSMTGLRMNNLYKSSSDDEFVTVTNSNGEFLFNVADGIYELTLSIYGYSPYREQVVVNGVNLDKSFVVDKIEMALQKRFSYARDFMAYLSNSQELGCGHMYTPSFIASKSAVGKKMNAVYFYTYESGINAKIEIYVGGVLSQSWSVVTGRGLNVSAIPSDFVMPSGANVELRIIGGGTIFIDEGPATTGQSDLIRFDGVWSTLKEFGFNGNICIGFWTDKGVDELNEPQVRVSYLGQREVGLRLYSEDVGFDKWEVKVGDNVWALSPTSRYYEVTGLTPQTAYSISVASVNGGKKGVSNLSLTTKSITAPYAAIEAVVVNDGASSDGTYLPRLTNLNSVPKSVKWFLNGKARSANEYIDLSKAGQYKIMARIVWNDNREETIVKVINIKQK